MASAMDHAMAKSPTESPLSSLVRNVSTKRSRAPPPPTITFQYDDDGQYEPQQPFQGQIAQIAQPLHSPLLHGHFARDSIATASSYERNSMLESASSNSSRIQSFSSNAYPDSELDYNYHYDNAYEESVYSQPDMGSALRDSWRSTASTSTVKASGTTLDGTSDPYAAYTPSEPYAQAWADPRQQYAPQPPSPVPAVVVSAPETPTQSQAAGRAPITQRVSPNFSRPGRPPPPSEEQKREVLLRNSGRQRSESPSSSHTSRHKDPSPSPLRNQVHSSAAEGSQPSSVYDAQQASQSSAIYSNGAAYGQPRSDEQQYPQPPPMNPRAPSQASLSPRDALNHQNHSSPPSSNIQSNSQHRPPPAQRAESSHSLYSNYSYYPFENAVPSPTGSTFSNAGDPFSVQRNPTPSGSRQSSSKLNNSSSATDLSRPPSASQTPKTPNDFLMLGIEHHEADRLGESARCFERSANEQGGCGVGMLMWGLTLRHGWGCAKNEKLAFKWLQKAAEYALGDLEATRVKGIKDTSVVKSELILAIYEVGQCFFQGWGVPKDQKMAVKYYTMAAELGDPDAQMDLAFCLTNAKGCKKDKRQAAKWYRAAIKQGQSDVGLAWIYKDKYQ